MRAIILGVVFCCAAMALPTSDSAAADARRVRHVVADGAPAYQALYTFEGGKKEFIGGPDGSFPNGDLSYVNGLFYGTTSFGGFVGAHYGNGVAFSLTPAGVETVLHFFTAGLDGFQPSAGLTYVNGTFYGTTPWGGLKNGTGGNGTVFAMSPFGLESVIPLTPENGHQASGKLTAYDGSLYGTAAYGGLDGDHGTVFRVTREGTLRVIHRFSGPPNDGYAPEGGLVAVGGVLYGLTSFGGTNNVGTVYAIGPSGAERVVHAFGGPGDGMYPVDRLIAVDGMLFGVTQSGGGNSSCGVVFALDPLGAESILHRFGGSASGDGCGPVSRVTAFNSALYGTTQTGGAANLGTIFKLSRSPGRQERVLYSFTCAAPGCPTGYGPIGGLTAVGNSLYGTTLGNDVDEGGVFFKFTP